MSDYLVVLLKILAMFLVILLGWLARRRNYLSSETTVTISRFVVDITIPALVFTQMLKTVNADILRQSWFLPVLGAAVILTGYVVGRLTLPAFARGDQRGTFVFLVAVANWVYLPLPIIQALYGNDGVSVLLLTNVGSQVVLWTIGVWTLRGGKPDLASLRNLATNPGFIAIFIGILAAVAVPGLGALAAMTGATAATASPVALFTSAALQGLDMVGSLTIPLSLILTGAQLGELQIADHRPSLVLNGILFARLAVTPLAFLGLVWLFAHAGHTIPLVPRMTAYIIAAMPAAVSCSIFTERFGGDTSLAARAIFYSTLLSIATVPAFILLVQRLGV